MKLYFPNLTRPKMASMQLKRALFVPLSSAQQAIAKACGYADWHDLEASRPRATSSPLDQDIEHVEFVARQSKLAQSIATSLRLPSGDVQYALINARLSGDRPPKLEDQIAIRLAIWRDTSLPEAPRRSRGAIGTLRTPGRNGERVILRHFGSGTSVVSHQNITTVADFEYVSPRSILPIFLPKRLYMPYGYWTEPAGARVLFSRDYKPLWRLQENVAPERLEPWSWIKKIGETHLWPDQTAPWQSSILGHEMLAFLSKSGINALPMLADCLPILVHCQDTRLSAMSEAPGILEQQRASPVQGDTAPNA